MTHLLTRKSLAVLTPAACIAVAAVLFFTLDNKPAFARVLERLRQTPTIVCHVSAGVAGGVTNAQVDGTLTMSAEHGTRFEMLNNGEPFSTIYRRPDGTIVALTPMTRTVATVHSTDANDSLHQSPDAWLDSLRRMTGNADRRLGRKSLDGHEVEGFEISGSRLMREGAAKPGGHALLPNTTATLWVDVQTWLPVRFEITGSGLEKGSQIVAVHDQFRWNETPAAEYFEPRIPEDYTTLDLTMPAMNEQALLDGLKLYADAIGEYPQNLEPATMTARLAAHIAQLSAAAHTAAPEVVQAAGAKAMTLGAACGFYIKLQTDGSSPEYFGEDVKVGDAAAVLLRYRLNERECRVIYGDLRAETVAAGK